MRWHWWKSCGGNAAVVAVLPPNKIWCRSQDSAGGEVWLSKKRGGWHRRGKESSSLPGILTVARGMAAMATACFLHNTT